MQRQRSRNIQHLIHAGFGCLRHSSAGVGGQGFQVAARTLGVQHTKRKGGFAGAGHPRNAHDFTQWNININLFEIVDFRSTNQYLINHYVTPNDQEDWYRVGAKGVLSLSQFVSRLTKHRFL